MARVKNLKSKAEAASGPCVDLHSLRLIGMVHLPPLPGAPLSTLPMTVIIRRAVSEAKVLQSAGFDAVIVENFGDAPFTAYGVSPETIACMGIVAHELAAVLRIPLGVNVLRNDAFAALAIAVAAGAAFIRVNVLTGVCATDQGMITGPAHDLMRQRAALAPGVAVAADVHVKHATPISQPDLTLAAEETAYRGGADALIVSGPTTGRPPAAEALRRVRAAVADRPLWVGSGVTADTAATCLQVADGLIVGTCLKQGGRTTAALDRRRVAALVRAAGGR